MTDPTQTLPLMPLLKSGEYDPRTASNQIRDGSENKPQRKKDPNLVWGAVTNYAQHIRDVLIQFLYFPLPIETLLPYG